MKTFLLLTAASVLCVSLAESVFFFVNELKTWTDAQSYCRDKFGDLVIINSIDDVTTLSSMVNLTAMVYQIVQHRAWIGLYDDVNGWKWSFSDRNFYNSGESQYRNWSSGQPNDYQHQESCVRTFDNGLWGDANCARSLYAVCADVRGQDATFVYINTLMNWTDAQSYCREHHTDLVSVRNMSENEKMKELIPAGKEAWIGLYRDAWKWVDGRLLSLSNWKQGEPDISGENCATVSFDDSGRWEDWPCSWNMPFFCYDVPVFQKAVRLKLERSSTLDLNDPAVLEDLLQQLKQKLMGDGQNGDVKLKWTTQSDGRIVHRGGG